LKIPDRKTGQKPREGDKVVISSTNISPFQRLQIFAAFDFINIINCIFFYSINIIIMACDPKTFNNVDQNVFEGLKSKLRSLGYTLEGTSGTIKGPMSLSIDYKWDQAASTLFVHVTDKSFLIPCGRIHSELEKAIAEVQ
jgi:hypothetical protein